MAENTIQIRNLRNDTLSFGPIFKAKDDRKGLIIELGAACDHGLVGGAAQPTADVPAWAFAKLKQSKAFETLLETRHIAIGGA